MNSQQTISEVGHIYKSKVKASKRPKIVSSTETFELFYDSTLSTSVPKSLHRPIASSLYLLFPFSPLLTSGGASLRSAFPWFQSCK